MMNFIHDIFKSRSIYRVLLHREIVRVAGGWSGEIIDLAGGGNASYYPLVPKNATIVRTNRMPGVGIDTSVDLNEPLPFPDESAHTVLFFNAIYIIKDRLALLREINRILAPGGRLYIASPFIANEMPDPDDFGRPTAQGLAEEFHAAGFRKIEIRRFGERFTAAAYLMHPFFVFNIVRIVAYTVALFCDQCIPRRVRKFYPTPLGYFCIIEK